MPIIVPVLRLGLLGLNVYQSYKVLKLPPLSSRTGQLSARAMTQRKRNMKGCMAVWLVWCCYTVFERMFDGVLSIFLPFYSEIKAVSLLFLILTRARGAEPIFLHVLRPAIKPYASTLDWALETAHTLGDFTLLVLSIPLSLATGQWQALRDYLMSRWNRGVSAGANQQHYSHSEQATTKRRDDEQTSRTPMPTLPKYMQSSDLQAKGPQAASGPTIPTSLQPRIPSPHKIWYPPDMISNGTSPPRAPEVNVSNGALQAHPFADSGVSIHDMTGSPGLVEADSSSSSDWSRYPPFPSAYPITPATSHDAPLPSYPPVRPRVVSTGNLQNQSTTATALPRPPKPIVSQTAPGIVSGRPRNTDLSGPHRRDDMRWEIDELGFGVSLERPRESAEDSDLRSGSGDNQPNTTPSPQMIADTTVSMVPKGGVPMLVDDDEDHASHNLQSDANGSLQSRSSIPQVGRRRQGLRSSQQISNLQISSSTADRLSTVSRANSRSSTLSTGSNVTSLQTPATEPVELAPSSESGYSRSSSGDSSALQHPAPPFIGRKRSSSRPAAGDSKKSRLAPSVKFPARPALTAKTNKATQKTSTTTQPKSSIKGNPPVPLRSSKRKREMIDPSSASSETLTRTTDDDSSTTKVDSEDRNATLKGRRRNPLRKQTISLLTSDEEDSSPVVTKQPRTRSALPTRRS